MIPDYSRPSCYEDENGLVVINWTLSDLAKPFSEGGPTMAERNRILFERAMSPDATKEGVFRDHHCPVCQDGKKPCKTKVVGNCGNLFARND